MASSSASTVKTAGPGDPIASARRVFTTAVEGIQAMDKSLGSDFKACVELFLGIKGRVIVSGMGKSGHVGHKIAATLASTGTPAFFVHAAEASHGDLGMITNDDAVLALSNSGETSELADLIDYTRRFGIKLVAITSKRNSSLGQAADIVLELPGVPEACPLGLAPTTSTTMMLALGDALAVSLLERRGFTSDDYKVFHPGGKLGRRLLKVADLMHAGHELPLVKPGTSMSDTIVVMTQKTFGIAGVVDGGKLIGVVTDGDLRRHLQSGLLERTAGDIMTRNPKSTRGGMLAQEALRLMNEWKVACLFVVDDGAPVGIVRLHDILRAGAA
ncbi:MAG: KpsF/GutQ family sugar-phosphate isomerase [Rhodospirillaceae bacterium]|nr:KpsF/GutQ family sugar-phosphate isomerase [Rhodospirillaceae bacterium]